MKRFQSVLVGVELADDNHLVADTLSPPAEEAIDRAVWLAKTNDATLSFLHVLPAWAKDLDASADLLPAALEGQPTLLDHASAVLAGLADRARDEGVSADSHVVFGKSWIETIRRVIRGHHDIVVVGARHRDSVREILLGSTAVKLLRKCPCPVWVTKPQAERRIASILVAHDLRPVGDLSMELGCSMAELHDAEVHVLHAAEYPEYDHMFPQRVSAESAIAYRQKAEQHITAQLRQFSLSMPARVHFVTQSPDLAILDHIERYSVALLVMGTIARTGIPGLVTGNTAERLLPRVPCSILAVKPAGFQSPITLDEH